MDVADLARLQFAFTAAYHFMFVPLSVGVGLIMAIFQTKAYRENTPQNVAAATFWARFFTVTFAVGVATGITMEFSFGTNWADYSRFVGDIFGAPLAAEALFAFFLESTFLGVVIFGRNRVSKKFYLASAWLVWAGSCLSALWIIIANSWMQTPAGYTISADGTRALMTDFFQAAFNPSTLARYFHTVIALVIMGALVAVAIGAYHARHGKAEFGHKSIAVGTIVAIAACVAMLPAMHQQAVVTSVQQPEKLAAMEAQYEDGPADMWILGWVDEQNESVIGIAVPIDGMTSILIANDPAYETMGLHSVKAEYGETAPVQVVFQAYHLMVAGFGGIALWVLLGLIAMVKHKKGKEVGNGLLKALYFGPIFPFLCIESGWFVAEIGRQPWIVWELLRTDAAYSQSVDPVQLTITLVLFAAIYLFILIMYIRIALRVIKESPKDELPAASAEGQVM
ncbi:cytochrome ubiquinol oxidase subunit I [Curtanaerobium respiraculi]|uniref:cytochrome ubiquinol oxidase subunit I n=1 Tax=Curtanaerobium respiraculi TaxID=2949669 RepID=UPI0024B35A30|nr:cytochrome ubiquinol oxidase subunit I [Curtanaerobium respiraculi]